MQSTMAGEVLNEDRGLEAKLQFKRRGVCAGGVTYLNHSPQFVKRAEGILTPVHGLQEVHHREFARG